VRALDPFASGSDKAPGRRAPLQSAAPRAQADENAAELKSWQRFARVRRATSGVA